MNFEIFDSAHSELPKLLRGELDVGFLSAKDASKVFELSKSGIVLLGVAQNESLFLLTNDESYGALDDLKGKTIICSEETGISTEIFKHILSKKEIPFDTGEESVKIDTSVPQASIANSLITGAVSYAVTCEPFASIALTHSAKTVRAENVQKLYSDDEDGSSIPGMVLVARSDFVKNNRDLVRRFIDVYRNAVQWTTKNPSKAGILAEKHNLGLKSSVVKNAIQNSGIIFREATSAKSDLEKLYAILNLKAPSEEFYLSR